MLWVGFAMLWVFRLEIVTFPQRTICLKSFLLWVADVLAKWSLDIPSWDFPDNPVVKTLHSNTGGVGSILGCWAKILQASGPENQKKKKKKTTRKTNKPWNGRNIVTNSIKTLKMVCIRKKKKIPTAGRHFLGQNSSPFALSPWSEVKSLSRVRLFATPWTIAYQAPLSVGFSRQEYWSGLPFPSPGDLPYPGIKPRSPALWADALSSKPPGKPILTWLMFSCWFKFTNKMPW